MSFVFGVFSICGCGVRVLILNCFILLRYFW